MINRIFLCLFSLLLCISLLGGCKSAAATDGNVSASDVAFLDTLTFLGDSTTAHMQQRSKIPAARIWAAKDRYLNLDSRITYAKIIAPDTGKEETIASVAARLRPVRLVITLGADYGVYYYRDKPEVFRLYYEKLLDAISAASPETELILQSVFPVAATCRVLTNEMIDRANAVIREIAEKRGLFYVDQKPILADKDGFLRPEFCFSDDGIHLTESAYSAILSHLASLADEIGGSR